MKHIKSFIVATAVTSGLLSANAQTTVFNDTFTSGLDTVQQASPAAPGANYSTFQFFTQGINPVTPTISSGDMQLRGRTTASAVAEVQSVFTTSPVSLTTIGDWIDLTITFVNTTNIMPATYASTLNIGLYNSGGVYPVSGVRLDAAGSGTGGAVGWLGYVGRFSGTNNASSTMFTRAAQGAGITNPNQSQDALFNNASSTSTFNNPVGTTIGNTAGNLASTPLTSGSVYTIDYQIMLSAAGVLTISNALYSGNSVNPVNMLISAIATAGGSTNITQTFDSFALGWRYNATSGPNAIDMNSITVTDNIQAVPEPTALTLGGLGILGLVAVRRFRRS
jgi:hypothetical protein